MTFTEFSEKNSKLTIRGFLRKLYIYNAREFLDLSRFFCLQANLSSLHVPGPTESLAPFSRYLQKIHSNTYKKIYRPYSRGKSEEGGGIAEKECSPFPVTAP